MKFFRSWWQSRKVSCKRVWLDLGDPGSLVKPAGPHEAWQDHGMGLLRTILHKNGIQTDLCSTRSYLVWEEVQQALTGYNMLLMNVRSYTFPLAVKAAESFKKVNPKGKVIVGGMHATVAPAEMLAVDAFDWVCQGPGENVIIELVSHPAMFPRLVKGLGARSMMEWPVIDRTLWPKSVDPNARFVNPWPLEGACGWGPSPVATMLTSRVCPWKCAFCNESSYIPNMRRRPVAMVIDELNELDEKYGPLGSIVFHDSMFFQHPRWLREWLREYPKRANKVWPYWASARPDTIRRWPDLFEQLIRETNWTTVSVGFESGSDRVLRILNKECTVADNYFAINLLNRIGDEFEQQGREVPRFWANIILAIPGETREDAFKTLAMLRTMKRAMPTIAYFAPYPGSALGYQLMAEGRSLIDPEHYNRFAGEEKVKGLDYAFYRDLMNGLYKNEIDELYRTAVPGMPPEAQDDGAFKPQGHNFYLYSLKNGKKKLMYGCDIDDAFDILRSRMTADEINEFIPGQFQKITQKDIPAYVHELG